MSQMLDSIHHRLKRKHDINADVGINVVADMKIDMANDINVNMTNDMVADIDDDGPCFYGPIAIVAQIF
jgi:hypothetical protein